MEPSKAHLVGKLGNKLTMYILKNYVVCCMCARISFFPPPPPPYLLRAGIAQSLSGNVPQEVNASDFDSILPYEYCLAVSHSETKATFDAKNRLVEMTKKIGHQDASERTN